MLYWASCGYVPECTWSLQINMEDLPDELLSNILEYLDPVTKLRTALVNRRFFEIATDPHLHRYSTFKCSYYLPERFITAYIKKFGSVFKYFSLQDCYWLKLADISVIQHCCSNLTHLDLLGCTEIPVNIVLVIFKQNIHLQHFGWMVGLDLLSKLRNVRSPEGQFAIEQINGISVLFNNLVSLKVGLQVYSATAYRDAFEPEAALFMHMISRIISPKLQKLYVICLERGQLMLVPKMSRVLLEVSVELQKLNESSTAFVSDMRNFFANTRNELTIAAISKHDGIIRGWLKFALAQKDYTIRRLAVPGPPFLNFWIPLLGNGLKSCELTEIKALDISSSHDVPIYWMCSVLKANSLRFLNLSNMECVSGTLLFVISENSPHLESLNLQGCHDCLDPISGLKSIATKCRRLRHLNLGRIHYHTSTPNNELMAILATMKYLLSFSLSGCSIMPYQCSSEKSNQDDSGVMESNKEETDALSSSYDSLSSDDSLSSGFAFDDDDDGGEDLKALVQQTDESPHSLKSFTLACSFLQEVEIIAVGFHSVLRKGWSTSRPPPERAHLIWDCPDQESEFLEALAFCSCLEKLTLAGLDIRSGLEFLVKIALSCTRLSFLSLAQLQGLETNCALPTLTRALGNCYSLKQLRFEQSYFAVPQSFIMALSHAVDLEALCIVTKGGSIAVSAILPLFEKPETRLDVFFILDQQCQKLRVLQICADASSSEETFRNITSILNNRYSTERPGLAVCLFPYDSNTRDLHDKLFNHANEHSFPLVHLKNLSLFGSEVATTHYH